MSKQVFWLASYPKSGNTLLRSIIISLFFTEDGLFTLDQSPKITQFEKTVHLQRNKDIFQNNFEKIKDISIFSKYWIELQQKKALSFEQDFIFLKTHSGALSVNNNFFTTEQNVRGIIYIVRDPRDVVISWSKHSGISIQDTLEFMSNDYATLEWQEPRLSENIFSDKNRPKSLISSWDKHVTSWTSINWKVPKMIIKFEDMVYNKREVINNLIVFFEKNFGFKFNNKNQKISNILKSTDFEKLKKEEELKGFIEAPIGKKFFSVGKKNQWQNILEPKHVKHIERKFAKVMSKFKY